MYAAGSLLFTRNITRTVSLGYQFAAKIRRPDVTRQSGRETKEKATISSDLLGFMAATP